MLARVIGHGMESSGTHAIDSTFSEELVVSRETSLWRLDGSPVSIADLYGTKMRVRVTVATDPVVLPAAMKLEEQDDEGITPSKSLE